MGNINVLMHAIFCTYAMRQVCSMKMQFKSRVPPYQHVEGVRECTQEVNNGVRLRSGVVRGCKVWEIRTFSIVHILYFCKEAGRQHVDAVSVQSFTITA